MNIIETENLTRRFGRNEAVHGLNLSVPQGSVLALLGPNGAGKSTTIKLLMNLLEPTSGMARGCFTCSKTARYRSGRCVISPLSCRLGRRSWSTIRA
jgi:ABC-2 type transport system ATP-binding protein